MTKLITICAVVCIMAFLVTVAAAGPIGYSVKSDVDNHVYRIDLGTGATTDLGLVGNSDIQGLEIVGGYLYGIGGTVEEFWNLTFPPGYKIGDTGPREGVDAGLAWHPDGGGETMYNIQRAGGTTWLYKIDMLTGSATLVGSDSVGDAGGPDALAIDSFGAAYALEALATDYLYKVDLDTGALTAVGTGLGYNLTAEAGLAFDSAGTLWALTDDGEIYTVNTSTGAATFITTTDTGFESLAIGDIVIPAPGAILLGGIGVGLVGWLRRRRTL